MSRVGRRQQQHFSSKEPYLEVPGGSFPEPTLASPNLDSTIDTWAPSSPATAGCLYTAVEARIQLRDKIIPSYPSLKHAYARANVYGEDSIRCVVQTSLLGVCSGPHSL